MATADAIAALQERFPELALEPRPLRRQGGGRAAEQFWLRIPPDRLLEVARFARDDARTRFEQLSDLTCVDYLNFPDAEDRFAVIYNLVSITHNHRGATKGLGIQLATSYLYRAFIQVALADAI